MNNIIIKDLDFILKSNIDWEKFRNKTFLVTGAYGMLLSYMIYSLLRLNELDSKFDIKIIALVRNKDKAKKRFEHFSGSKLLELLEHDLSSPIQIHTNIDFIIHGASYASPHYFIVDPIKVLMPNVIGTYYLLQLAKAKIVKGFLYFSSGAVYGKPVKGEVVTEKDYGYLDPLELSSCYGESKRMGENMCKCWNKKFGIPVKIVRPAHIYGPTMDIENDTRVFASFVNDILKGQNIEMKSDGSTCRSFCYIADATVAYFKVLLNGEEGEAYNVGNDSAYVSIRNLAEILVSAFPEKKLQITTTTKKDVISSERGAVNMLMSSKKIESLGWKCSFSILEGVKRTVESYL